MIRAVLIALTVSLCFCVLSVSANIGMTKSAFETGKSILNISEQEERTQWEQLIQLNVWAVSSVGEKNILSPSSEGRCALTVRNATRFPLRYTFSISDEHIERFPLLYRLRDSTGSYLFGADGEWIEADEITGVSGNLDYKADTVYTLEWKWMSASDEIDTATGILGQQNMTYALNFNLTAEQTGSAVVEEPLLTGSAPKITDGSHFAFWFSLFYVCMIVFIIQFVCLMIET